jgi:hypothetical protein
LPIPHQQEWARQIIAFTLAASLGIEIFGVIVAILFPVFRCEQIPLEAIKERMLIIFSPTVALVGSAIGFYFASPPQSVAGHPPSDD